MADIPREKTLDSTLSLLRDGYPFIQKRCKQYGTDIFETRVLGKKAICIHGEEAARVFYDNERFQRAGALPKPIKKTLFGEGGVQGLDGEAHKQRKAMFMSLMSPDNIERLMKLTAEQWQAYGNKWERGTHLVVLFEEAQEIFCRAACAWTGVPLKEEEVKYRTQDFTAMVDSFGAAGPRYFRGLPARARTEKWLRAIIDKIRNRSLEVNEGSAAHVFATSRDADGSLLDTRIAAVELINVIRPYVAIAYYVAFSALALHEHPEYREKLRNGDDRDVKMFVQEVRRFYPFAPLLGAIVRKDFNWRGHHFKKGRMVLLDIYGPLHDAKLWEEPYEFRPERFMEWKGSPFDFVPQGGGDHEMGHRCAGEWITIGAMQVSLQFLTAMEYEVPAQDLGFSLSRIPTFPRSGFVIKNVKISADMSRINTRFNFS
jgi:fatty-acid peroxygenase